MVVTLGKWAGRTAIVTGAGSGIGAAIATRLLKEGLKVVGLDINTDRWKGSDNSKNGSLLAIKTDLTKEEQILNAFDYVKTNMGPIQVLINCAGIMPKNTLINGNTEQWRKLLDTNVLAYCITTREAINNMKEYKIDDGHIIHLCSVSGHTVPTVPNLNLYPASKHAVRAMKETLRSELNQEKSKIKISTISPGVVKTQIFEMFDPELRDMVMEGPFLYPEDIAEAVTYVLSAPPHVQIDDLKIRPQGEIY